MIKFSWDEYRLDNSNSNAYEALLATNRDDLLEDFRNTRQINAKISKLIKDSIKIAQQRKWKNVEVINNSLWFVLQRDTDIKIKAEQLLESDDHDRIIRAAIETCGLIFEILQKVEVIAGGKFNKAAREIGVPEDVIKTLNAHKKVIHQFSQTHSKSLKFVRDSASSHFDTNHEIYQLISDNIERQKIISMLVDFAMKFNTMAMAMQSAMTAGVKSIEANPSLGS